MKIALIRSPWWVRYCPPYILAFFATLLRSKGHEASCFDLNNSIYHASSDEYRKYWDDRDYYSYWENPAFVRKIVSDEIFEEKINEILQTESEVICFTTHTPNALISMEMAKKIKERDNKKIIVFMGHKCARTQMAFDFAQKDYIDYVCTGEADIALCDLLDKLSGRGNSSSLPECRGFLMKRDKKIIDCGNPEIVEDLDELPFPDYDDFIDDINESRYSQPQRLDILDSRGCINSCHFCYEKIYWQKYRSMSGKKIFEQISFYKKKFPNINYFYFNGLLLNGDLKALEEFCDLVIESDLKIRWAGQAMIRGDMSRELLEKMTSAGCEWLYYGIESGSVRVLEQMNKKHKPEEAIKVLKDTREAGIDAQINIMFGFPTETEDDFKETMDFLRFVRPYINNVLASQSFCTLEKETFMKKNPEKFGINDSSHHLYWESMDGKNNYEERFRRYEEFCRLALSLGLPETSGVLRKKPDKWVLLGDYHIYKENYTKAVECYNRSIEEEELTKSIYTKLAEAHATTNNIKMAIDNYKKALGFEGRDKEIESDDDNMIRDKIEELQKRV